MMTNGSIVVKNSTASSAASTPPSISTNRFPTATNGPVRRDRSRRAYRSSAMRLSASLRWRSAMNGKLGALRPPRSVVTSRRSRAPVRPAAHAGSKNVSADTLRPTLIVVRRARSRRPDDGLSGGPDVGDGAIVPPVLVVLRLEQSPQVGEVLAVRAPHRQLHDRGHRLGEPGWFTAVAQCHPRRAARLGSPRVGGLHRERASLRAHDQPLAGN